MTLAPTLAPSATNALQDCDPFISYVYSYPHKTAYREITPAVPLAEAWRGEPRDALFLYVHVPFCETRCGFCNLFTVSRPEAGPAGSLSRSTGPPGGASSEATGRNAGSPDWQ